MAAELKVIGIDPIPEGQRFVALYDDGSGCTLGMGMPKGKLRLANYNNTEDALTYDQDWLQDAGYTYWLPLPDDFKLWFERVEASPAAPVDEIDEEVDYATRAEAFWEKRGEAAAEKGVYSPPYSDDNDPQDEDANADYRRGFMKRAAELGDKFKWA